MFQSFFVYIFFGLIMFVLGNFSKIRERNNLLQGKPTSFWVWDVILALLVFAFISGVRWNVGVDYLAYLDNYLRFQNGGYFLFDKEIGFEFITRLFAGSKIHFSLYFGFLAFLQIFFIYRAFKDERYLYPFIGIVIIFGPHYLSWMNGIRQMIAATMFVYSIQFIQNRQFIKYILIISLAGLFHTSAFVLLLFYFIPQRDYFKNRTFTLALVVITLVLGNMSFWIENIKGISVFLDALGYDFYAENIERLVEENEIRLIGPRRLSIMLVAFFTIWFSPQLKAAFKTTSFLRFYNLAIIGFLLYNLFGNTNHIFIRPLTYLTIFSIPTTAYLLVFLKSRISKNTFIFLVVIIVSLSYLPLSIIADKGKDIEDYTNFKFYWYH